MYSSIAIIPQKKKRTCISKPFEPCEGWKSWKRRIFRWRFFPSAASEGAPLRRGAWFLVRWLVIVSEGIDILWQSIEAKCIYVADCEWGKSQLYQLDHISACVWSYHHIWFSSIWNEPMKPPAECIGKQQKSLSPSPRATRKCLSPPDWEACDGHVMMKHQSSVIWGEEINAFSRWLKRWNFSRNLFHGNFRVTPPPIPTPPANKEGLVAPWFLKNA